MIKSTIEDVLIHVFKHSFKERYKRALFCDFQYELNSHPDFPTLKSISDTLGKFGIENVPVRLKPNELEQLDSPFLAYFTSKGQNELAYVKPLQDKNIHLISESLKPKTESINTFSSSFTGIAVLLDIEKATLPQANSAKLKDRVLFKSILALILVSLLGFLVLGIYNIRAELFSSVTSVFLIITKFLGLALAIALVIKGFGESSTLLDKVCKLGKKADCNTVLESRYATVYGWLKWSDLGLIYFLSSLLLMCIDSLGMVIVLTLVSFPYVIISLYQQVFLIKKLCPLCIGVLAILTTDFIVVLNLVSEMTISFTQFFGSTFLILITGVLYLTIKSLILTKIDKTALEYRYNRLKRIPEVVSTVVRKEKALILPKGIPMDYLSFGNHDKYSLKVQVFLSLHCGHCGRLFREFDGLINKTKDLRIDLFLGFNLKDKEHTAIMEDVLRDYYSGEVDKAWEMMRVWYAKPNKTKSMNQTDESFEVLKKLLFTTEYLMQANQISSLPRVYINGFEKSSYYKLEEYLEHSASLNHSNNVIQREMIINT